VARCPHLATYDPVAPEHVANPYPFFAEARKQCPVFYIPKEDMWCVTRHADILDVLRDTSTYTSVGSSDMRVELPRSVADEVGDDYAWPLDSQLSIIDPPEHTRIRKLIQPAFTPKALSRFEARVTEIVHGLIDEFIDDGEVELVEAFTRPIPALVITAVIGAAPEHARDLQRWVPSIFQLIGAADLTPSEAAQAWRDVVDLDKFTREFIAERRAQPQDDLTSDLIRARADDGDALLTDQEILGNTLGFIGAGADTTSVLLANTVFLLLQHRDQFEAVLADQSLIPKALEECLRYRSPAVSVVRRTTRRVVLGGVTLPEGADLWVHVASGNRDEEVFGEPDRFDVHRGDGAHLAFGLWTHFCIGAPLARMEARIALEALFSRIPELSLASGQDQLEYSRNMQIPDVHALRLRWPTR
jgi:cytochrome P450